MSSRRVDRVGEVVQQEIAQIITTELRDPRLRALVTVSHVMVSPDLQYATIAVSIMGDAAQKKEALLGLEAAGGFFRRELSRRVKLRYVPQLRFVLDTSLDQDERVAALLKQDNEQEPDRNA